MHESDTSMAAGRITARGQTASQARQARVQWYQQEQHITVTDTQLGMAVVDSHSTAGLSYLTCVADLSCSCPNAASLCSHLEAVAQQVPLTHNMRSHAATALQQLTSLHVVDVRTGLLTCTAFASEDQTFHVSLGEGICNCVDWQRNNLCCHLLAATYVLGSYTFPLPIPEPTDPAAPISCSTVYVQPSMASDTLTALCEEHYPKLIAAKATLETSISTAASRDPKISQVETDVRRLKRAVAALPTGEEQDQIVQQLHDLSIRADETAAQHALPVTHKHGELEGSHNFNRQPSDRRHKPLQSRTQRTATGLQAAARHQAASAAVHAPVQASAATAPMPADADKEYPTQKARGRAPKHVSLLLSVA